MLTTLKYGTESSLDMPTAIFQIRILLKKLKFFTTNYTDQQLIEEVQLATKGREERQRSSSPTKMFFNVFKRRNSAMSDTSNLSLPLEIDTSIKNSKSQYQTLSIRKFSFEASNLSKHPIKNLQSTINLLSDKEDNEHEEANDPPEQINQNTSSLSHLFSGRSSQSYKGKGKDTED